MIEILLIRSNQIMQDSKKQKNYITPNNSVGDSSIKTFVSWFKHWIYGLLFVWTFLSTFVLEVYIKLKVIIWIVNNIRLTQNLTCMLRKKRTCKKQLLDLTWEEALNHPIIHSRFFTSYAQNKRKFIFIMDKGLVHCSTVLNPSQIIPLLTE